MVNKAPNGDMIEFKGRKYIANNGNYYLLAEDRPDDVQVEIDGRKYVYDDGNLLLLSDKTYNSAKEMINDLSK